MTQGNLVSFDNYGIIRVLSDDMLDEVSAAGFIDLNGVCGSKLDANCYGSNLGCVASPNTYCGSNQVCDKF